MHGMYVADVLAADKQLASEIEFDLRKFEEEEKERQKQREKRTSSIAVSNVLYALDSTSLAVHRYEN